MWFGPNVWFGPIVWRTLTARWGGRYYEAQIISETGELGVPHLRLRTLFHAFNVISFLEILQFYSVGYNLHPISSCLRAPKGFLQCITHQGDTSLTFRQCSIHGKEGVGHSLHNLKIHFHTGLL